jgi:uncharacterized ferritin-like protein (DUF455 family)
MELREFAERVLFATSLEEKLQRPGNLTDERPGPARMTPEAPGRPLELQFKAAGTARDTFPGTRHLENERERGQLLHFFANHELLATELMALVLLKFPEAPSAFRHGVLRTLQDEQEHTRLYLQRMRDCGIHFGELPVSGYFWRSVSVMESPLDYVSSLCLTFEQANLDFARHFSTAFAQVGDNTTADLLQGIYRDEIAHVAYGLKWFRRWKNPQESDWEAFCRQLKFPLSPQRAKGITLNVAGRRAAGLDAEFIAELDVYAQSKGRTPNVFVFNPLAEARIAQGKAFNPARMQDQLVRDLENLPQFLCRQDDIVLVREKPAVKFLSGIKQAGFPLPEFVRLNQVGQLADRKLGRLRPWAWSPDSVELLAPLRPKLTAEKRSAEERFNPEIARLYSKAWSAGWLRTFLLSRAARSAWLCPGEAVGTVVERVEEALTAVAAIRSRGHHKVVVKAALGLAGGNALRLFEPQPSTSQIRWLEKALGAGRQLVVEPWMERAVDFSVQMEMTAEGLRLCGYTGLMNDVRGQFQANTAAPGHAKKIPAAVLACFPETPDIASQGHALYAEIFAGLETELRRVGYQGPLGIDAFVYREADGRLRLKPVVELNPRYTMGRLTLELMRQTAQGSHGRFELITPARLRAEGHNSFAACAHARQDQFPLQLTANSPPRILSGALCLNDPERAQSALAIFQVTRREGSSLPVVPFNLATPPGWKTGWLG